MMSTPVSFFRAAMRHAGGMVLLGTFSLVVGASAHAARSHAPPVHSMLSCDDRLKDRFHPDEETTVLLVRSFRQGEPLLLSGQATDRTPVAKADLCLVKLNVGPGKPGALASPSTSPGIGIEIWLPSPAKWNGRLHLKGGGGWAGSTQGSTTQLALDSAGVAGSPAETAGVEGAVSATTDTGHSYDKAGSSNLAGGNPSFALDPSGKINTVLWHDFAERGVHEMVLKTRALARVYYGHSARYAYWDGFSTGGRQGLMEAQAYPDDFDGILAGAPAINWTRFITNDLYPQIVMQQDLDGHRLTPAQLSAVSNAAIRACDVIGGQHLGYIPDPRLCRYDPVRDKAMLCVSDGGRNRSALCLSHAQALALNKMWYGQTSDGSVPDPMLDNGTDIHPGVRQQWYGLMRGTNLAAMAGPTPFPIAADMTAVELEDPSIATPAMVNEKSNGSDGWKKLGYADLKAAYDLGLARQAALSHINTDNPDLTAFRDHGGRLIMYHGLADMLIPPMNSIHYYNRVVERMGDVTEIQAFYRLYLIAGMNHGIANGTSNAAAVIPLPDHETLYEKLTDWVENGHAPGRYDIESSQPGGKKVSRPLCVFPQSAVFIGGNPDNKESYRCQ
ncbi:tannase/feruloyl esterase family alpha/beta hydrolase [Acetobacter senegalensis]|uniref:tannase/feruloyl esterase family alpha/beta hydrolase n=1 Tax=Acetobacter senegalensis TaxID=446692 RepID=UPI00265365BB|nr:tannase/feruloyl esterase family alpha/beta hydrolase [Acetobacter senegalensis]MDN7356248.1 tannase/feruloyl esterase family alpha/beta hydrolase [Acetobacter senegalensis]